MRTWTPCYQLILYLSFAVHFHEACDANQAYRATLHYGDNNEQGPVWHNLSLWAQLTHPPGPGYFGWAPDDISLGNELDSATLGALLTIAFAPLHPSISSKWVITSCIPAMSI